MPDGFDLIGDAAIGAGKQDVVRSLDDRLMEGGIQFRGAREISFLDGERAPGQWQRYGCSEMFGIVTCGKTQRAAFKYSPHLAYRPDALGT